MSPAGATDRPATMLCNISIIPARDVANAVLGLSSRLVNSGGLFEIDDVDRHAHVTLYMARFCPDSLEELLSRVKKALVGAEPLQLAQDGYFVTPGNYYEVSYKRDRPLLALHDTITRAVRSLRHVASTPVVEDYYGPYSAEQRENVRRHGYDLAGRLYRPHITITRFPGAAPEPLPVSPADLSFTATTIGVFRADRLGAARELIQAFPLTVSA